MKQRGTMISDDTKANDLVCTVVDFFTSLSLTGSRVVDKSNFFNVLFEMADIRMGYSCAPMYWNYGLFFFICSQ